MKALKLLNYMFDEGNFQSIRPEINEAIAELEALQSQFTRVEVISKEGRVFCDRCRDGSYYELSIQDGGRTLKLLERSNR